MELTLAQKLAAFILSRGDAEEIQELLNTFEPEEAELIQNEFDNVQHLSKEEVDAIIEELYSENTSEEEQAALEDEVPDPEQQIEAESDELASRMVTAEPEAVKPQLGSSGEDPVRWSVKLNDVPPPVVEDPFRNSEFTATSGAAPAPVPGKLPGNTVYGTSPSAFKTSDFTRSKSGLGVRNDGEPIKPEDRNPTWGK